MFIRDSIITKYIIIINILLKINFFIFNNRNYFKETLYSNTSYSLNELILLYFYIILHMYYTNINMKNKNKNTFPPPRPAAQTHTTLITFTNKHRTAVILGIRTPFK